MIYNLPILFKLFAVRNSGDVSINIDENWPMMNYVYATANRMISVVTMLSNSYLEHCVIIFCPDT